MPDIRKDLSEILDQAEWEWLIPHVQREAVILVSMDLDLLDVGEAIATDNTSSVQQWIEGQLITKPSVTQVGKWNCDREKRFNTLIIQPYVLVQEIAA
ncbi:DUF2288 domain-containing protein [Nostoc sp. UHCC 0870]|uniref:DUF2288 domain-containing protein n=1 Tax=Nostoc sp. UHCC 0870 TaxID=2914041 RepID=UPI001EDF5E3A|nr:DUF2288 domain-containing protein [Nostoc sp. UHCC 0870]UKO96335.1 DUF2288 domain-containing protein [Nostoc sp. UHCC 0870]